MDNLGFIRVDRKILKNKTVCEDAEHFMIWMFLLLNATYKEYEVEFNGKRIILKPGQLITGRNSMAADIKINPNKIQRVLKKFESRHLIEQETTNKNRLITIVRWNEYQIGRHQDEHQPDINPTSKRHQNDTNKNIKNIKNIYIYLYKKYKGEYLRTLKDRMKFLNEIKNDDEYKKMTYEEQYDFRTYVLSGGNYE